MEQLLDILSVIKDFEFILHEKYQIATDRPGSGNTKNIGSVINIDELRNGAGPFSKLGIDVFDDYWMYCMTSDMARAAELTKPPYSNLKQYFEYKKLKTKKEDANS
ncbi:MAG: EcoRV family type II restriction endonuclease [Candidatus Omnitrophica bacterium]|nr:EcoRV family type II restriction endonuclease [Candidatus Omnitrophota bacterium]